MADIGKTPEIVSVKRYIQQAELERHISGWATTLPIRDGTEPSADGVTREKAKPIGEPKARTTIYGIPKNGTIIAEMLAAYLRSQGKDVQTTFNADHANFIVDDLIDSGRTAEKYVKRWGVPVYALYDKREVNSSMIKGHSIQKGWIVFPWEADPLSVQSETDAVTRLIEMVGEDANRDGLLKTPERFIKAFKELTRGYELQVTMTQFEKDGFDQLVILKDIPFHSLCEHHLLPFFGKAHVGYVPNKKIIGVSKLARLVDKYACRLQNQERIGEQIVQEIEESLQPLGTAVILEATHLCCSSRGVAKAGMHMTTSKLTGYFRDNNQQARLELLHLINGRL